MSHRWACLLGQPVGHSLSPALHNAAFAALGMDAHYEARDVSPEDLPAAIAALRQGDCLGANVTAPHKQAALALVDDVSAEVVALGALNTIVNQSGRLIGANTDARGLARWMRQVGIDPTGQRTLVLGAGGAARATVWALADLDAKSVRVLNRTVDRAEDLVLALRPRLGNVELSWGPLDEAAGPPHAEGASAHEDGQTAGQAHAEGAGAHEDGQTAGQAHAEGAGAHEDGQTAGQATTAWPVIVNATSLGHHNAAPTVHPGCYSPGCVAIELAYNPPETGFMVAARQAGARTENGLGMLLHQAALAFELWTGRAPPLDVLAAAVNLKVAP